MNTSAKSYKHSIKSELILGSIHSLAGPNSKPTKQEIYLLAAQIQDRKDTSFERAIYFAMLSYDYYDYDYHYDYDYYYHYDYDYDYHYNYNHNYDYNHNHNHNYDYDYNKFSKEQKVIALLFLSAIHS